MEQLKYYFQNKKIQTALDVGTGTGDFLELLQDVIPGSRITGVDIDKDSLQIAREKFPGFDFFEMGAEKMDFSDNQFDVASISMALHHLTDVQKSLHEMLRVIKSGGWIIVSELFSDNLNEAQQVHKLYHHFKSTTDRVRGISHNETFKKKEIVSLIKNAGIDIQLQFEFNQEKNLIDGTKDVEARVEKMKAALEKIKGHPEYELLKPKIEEFRKRATEYGFQPATRIIVVGKVH
jgi:ubiquinone/menaquinone biosynthesis C-methylase UbiE